MERIEYDSADRGVPGLSTATTFPCRVTTAPPPMAVRAPLRDGTVSVEIVTTAPVVNDGFVANRPLTDKTRMSGVRGVGPVSFNARTLAEYVSPTRKGSQGPSADFSRIISTPGP